MQNIIDQLVKIGSKQAKRQQKSISNLIDRIEWFLECGDEVKLNECLAEANLWGAK